MFVGGGGLSENGRGTAERADKSCEIRVVIEKKQPVRPWKKDQKNKTEKHKKLLHP